jgi:hypothetical protein
VLWKLSQQVVSEVEGVVGEGAPQSDASDLGGPVYGHLGDPSGGSEIGVDGRAGGGSLLVDFLSLGLAMRLFQRNTAGLSPRFDSSSGPLLAADLAGLGATNSSTLPPIY